MGQYWLVVCPSKCEYTSPSGRKLVEMLFSPWANILGELIEDSWAGTSLVCIGDYLARDDLPIAIQQANPHLISSKGDAISNNLLYDIVEENFEFWTYEEEGEEATAAKEGDEATAAIAVNPKNRVLRNLTTGQYVSEDKLSSGITLGHIALMRICWSSELSTGITGGEYLAQGDWAGHKFDIVDADMLGYLNEEWEDITEDAWDKVNALWSSRFGENWETKWII